MKTLHQAIPQELVSLLYSCSENFDNTPLLVCSDWCQENNYHSLEFLLRYLAKRNERIIAAQLLLTGSRVYGIPKPESDFDWVIFTLEYYLNEIRPCADSIHEIKDSDGTLDSSEVSINYAFRFGPINLLVVNYDHQFKVWKEVTESLIKRKPVTRDEAVKAFKEGFESAYLTSNDGFSGEIQEDDNYYDDWILRDG